MSETKTKAKYEAAWLGSSVAFVVTSVVGTVALAAGAALAVAGPEDAQRMPLAIAAFCGVIWMANFFFAMLLGAVEKRAS